MTGDEKADVFIGCLAMLAWLLTVAGAIVGALYNSASAVGGALLVYLFCVLPFYGRRR